MKITRTIAAAATAALLLTGCASSDAGYGSDPTLDALQDKCEEGDRAACDDLYTDSPWGSEYESFAQERRDELDDVAEADEATEVEAVEAEPESAPAPEDGAYGSDPTLDALYDECEAGSDDACDDLYWDSPLGSQYEAFAEEQGADTTTGGMDDEPADDGPTMSMSQENALQSASDYLDYSAFSRSGLIEQLEYEDYSTADATFAVDQLAPNWREQAAQSAQDYLDYSSFSRQGLIDQLIYEGFTPDQATYGVNQTGLG